MGALKPATQPAVQQLLRGIHTKTGLDSALGWLFRWSLDNGYFADGAFEQNILFEFPDTETPVRFRTQVNYSRRGYTAPTQPTCTCPICFANVASSAKPLLRAYAFPLGAAETPYFIQLTPFPLRRHHYILIQTDHAPMRSGARCLDELVAFVAAAPRFTACSNSDVRDAGVSILDHHHYQVFRDFHLPVFDAIPVPGLERRHGEGEVGVLDYPLTTLRLRGTSSFVRHAAGGMCRWLEGHGPWTQCLQRDGAIQ